MKPAPVAYASGALAVPTASPSTNSVRAPAPPAYVRATWCQEPSNTAAYASALSPATRLARLWSSQPPSTDAVLSPRSSAKPRLHDADWPAPNARGTTSAFAGRTHAIIVRAPSSSSAPSAPARRGVASSPKVVVARENSCAGVARPDRGVVVSASHRSTNDEPSPYWMPGVDAESTFSHTLPLPSACGRQRWSFVVADWPRYTR